MEILNKYRLPETLCKSTYYSDKPSATVPDQTLTVQELLERFTTGLLSPGSVWREDVGDDFSDLDNPNPTDRPDFDMVDRDELIARGASAQRSLEKERQRSKTSEAPTTPTRNEEKEEKPSET